MLILIALVAPSVAITIWVLLVPAAVITRGYGPSSTQTMPPIDTKTLHRSREALPGHGPHR